MKLSIVFLAFFAAIVVVSLLGKKQLSSPIISVFRIFFPSWRFFEDFSEPPFAQFRFGAKGEELGDWKPLLPMPMRRWLSLAINSEYNLYLACQSLVQQLETEVGEVVSKEKSEFLNTVTYRLFRQLVRYQISALEGRSANYRYQFRVSRNIPGKGTESFLISTVEEI